MNGVNPIELVEIPISEFQRDFPNDPDAVQRRFERVDGARRRMLAYVIRDWKQLCASGWEPPRERPKSAKETIVQVSAGAHCTLLELQAQRFRKIETDNWDALNRQLKMELKQAELEQKNKMITKKHEEIQSNNDNAKRERQLMVEKLHREDMERLKKKHEDEAEEIRRLQALDSEAAAQKKIADEQNRLKEKEARERRELERVQREQYTKQLKNSIMSGLQNQTEAKKKVLAIRDKNMEDRIEQTRRERDQMMERRRLEKEQRLAKAKEDQLKQDEEDRLEVRCAHVFPSLYPSAYSLGCNPRRADHQMLERIAQNEEKRARLQEQRDRERKEANDRNEDVTREKLTKIKDATDGVVNGKASRTLEAIQLKEELARQELRKVQEAQEKRKCIKAIRCLYQRRCASPPNYSRANFLAPQIYQARGFQDGGSPRAESAGVQNDEDRGGPEEQRRPLRGHQKRVLRAGPHAQQHEGHHGEDKHGAQARDAPAAPQGRVLS
jgi:hypothetical protein